MKPAEILASALADATPYKNRGAGMGASIFKLLTRNPVVIDFFLVAPSHAHVSFGLLQI